MAVVQLQGVEGKVTHQVLTDLQIKSKQTIRLAWMWKPIKQSNNQTDDYKGRVVATSGSRKGALYNP